MFAFSPLVGLAADRFGRPRRPGGRGSGPAGLAGAVRLSPEGTSWQIFAGLFLLGLGWSCATVAASTIIADRTPLEARTDVQGTSDMAMALTAAGGGALAGVIVGGWATPRWRRSPRCWRGPSWSAGRRHPPALLRARSSATRATRRVRTPASNTCSG